MEPKKSADLPLAQSLPELSIAFTAIVAGLFLFSKLLLVEPASYLDPGINIYAIFGVMITFYGCLKLLQSGARKIAILCYVGQLACIATSTAVLFGTHAPVTLLWYLGTFMAGLLLLDMSSLKTWGVGFFLSFLACLLLNEMFPSSSRPSSFSFKNLEEYGVFTSIAGVSGYAVFLQRKRTQHLLPQAYRFQEYTKISKQELSPERFQQLLILAETSEALLHAIAKPLTAAQLCLEANHEKRSSTSQQLGLEQVRATATLCREACQALYDPSPQMVVFPEEVQTFIRQRRKLEPMMRLRFYNELSTTRLLTLDRVQWINAISNLLDNASQAIAHQCTSHQWIACSLSETTTHVRISVTNPGTLSHELRKNLFHSRISSNSSSGIGLMNTASWLKRIGGAINVSVSANQTITFSLFLPKKSLSHSRCSKPVNPVVSTHARSSQSSGSFA